MLATARPSCCRLSLVLPRGSVFVEQAVQFAVEIVAVRVDVRRNADGRRQRLRYLVGIIEHLQPTATDKAGISRRRHGHRHGLTRRHPREDRHENVGVPLSLP